jgi:hypothetical protein
MYLLLPDKIEASTRISPMDDFGLVREAPICLCRRMGHRVSRRSGAAAIFHHLTEITLTGVRASVMVRVPHKAGSVNQRRLIFRQ